MIPTRAPAPNPESSSLDEDFETAEQVTALYVCLQVVMLWGLFAVVFMVGAWHFAGQAVSYDDDAPPPSPPASPAKAAPKKQLSQREEMQAANMAKAQQAMVEATSCSADVGASSAAEEEPPLVKSATSGKL